MDPYLIWTSFYITLKTQTHQLFFLLTGWKVWIHIVMIHHIAQTKNGHVKTGNQAIKNMEPKVWCKETVPLYIRVGSSTYRFSKTRIQSVKSQNGICKSTFTLKYNLEGNLTFALISRFVNRRFVYGSR